MYVESKQKLGYSYLIIALDNKMTDLTFRLVINGIALGFAAHRMATQAVIAFVSRADSYFPSSVAIFVVVAFGAVLSIVDYIKRKP